MFKTYKVVVLVFIILFAFIIVLYRLNIFDYTLFFILLTIVSLILFLIKGFIVFRFHKENIEYREEAIKYSEKLKSLSNKVQLLNSEIDNLRKQLTLTIESLNSLQKEYTNISVYTKDYFNYFNNSKALLEKYFGDNYFIISYPKNEVGEEILFVKKVNDYIIVVIIDASGNGIQLFLNNLLILNILENATTKEKLSKPSEILEYVSKEIYENYNISHFPYVLTYSIGIVSILYKYKIVEYAGARNSLLYTHNGAIIEQKGDKNLINNFSNNLVNFNNSGIPVEDKTVLYLFTDGLSNQMINNKKLKRKYFINILNKYKDVYSLKEQCDLIKKEIEKLIINNEQTDDIKIIGIKVGSQ